MKEAKTQATPLERAMAKFENEPASVCTCGHTGDGPNSQHYNTLASGHGACKVPGCECGKFTWAKWRPEVEAAIEEARK